MTSVCDEFGEEAWILLAQSLSISDVQRLISRTLVVGSILVVLQTFISLEHTQWRGLEVVERRSKRWHTIDRGLSSSSRVRNLNASDRHASFGMRAVTGWA